MGVFDLPAPLLGWLDQQLGALLPPTARLILWGLIAAALSMGLYWAVSPQGRLTRVKVDALDARKRLDAHDGEFADAWPLMRRMLGLSLRQLAMTTWPAIVASIPVLALIVWLGTAYGYDLPAEDGAIAVQATPEQALSGRVEGASAPSPPRLLVTGSDGAVVSEIDLEAPVPTIHKRQWWNALFGNPLGYLPDESPIEALEIGLHEREYLPIGPSWLRPWYVLFFATLILGSIAIKVIGRIE
jgi:hypothetical protein